MKLPQGNWVLYDSPLVKMADQLANELTLEYGIFVEVQKVTETEDYSYLDMNGNTVRRQLFCVKEINFKVMDHVFENIKDLRKALELKAFL